MNGRRPTPQLLGIVAGTLVLGLLVGWVVGHYTGSTKTVTLGAQSPESPAAIEKAPNFSAADLSALPKDGWPTVGGSLMQERYSPLTQIDTSNVSQLKGVWMTHLNGSALAAKYSAESQPVVYKGVIYITTGNNDVFAVSVASGKILWSYSSGISQKISTICCGWLNRGVAIGDGRVYFGQLDGSVVALDQQTGKQLWKKQLVKLAARPDDHGGADLHRRQDLHRQRRGGVRGALVPRGDGRRDRRAGVALVHDAGAGRPGRRHLAGRLEGVSARRRDDLAGARRRPEARPHLLLDRQRRLRLVRRRPARQEPLRRLDRRARPARPARSSGTSSRSTTTSGTSTPRAP